MYVKPDDRFVQNQQSNLVVSKPAGPYKLEKINLLGLKTWCKICLGSTKYYCEKERDVSSVINKHQKTWCTNC